MEQEEVKECKIKEFFCSRTIAIILACLLCFFIGYYSGYDSSSNKTQSGKINRSGTVIPNRNIPKHTPNLKKLPTNIKKQINTPKRTPKVNPNLKTNSVPKPNIKPNISKTQNQKEVNTPPTTIKKDK